MAYKMESVPNHFNEPEKLLGINKYSCRIKAGNANTPEDNSNENSKSNTDLQNDEPKRKRKKRLKPPPPELVSFLKNKDDKYGIGALYNAKTVKQTNGQKQLRSLQERLQDKAPESNSNSPPPRPRFTFKTNKKQVFVSNIRKLPPESENVGPPKKVKTKSVSKDKPTGKIMSLNENGEQKGKRKMRTVSPANSEKSTKSMRSVCFQTEDEKSICETVPSEEYIGPQVNSLPKPSSTSFFSQMKMNKIVSNSFVQKIKMKRNSNKSLFSAKQSNSNTSEFQNKNVGPTSSASFGSKSQLETKLSITSSRDPPPLPPAIEEYSEPFPKEVESISSRKSLKKRIKPKQIILSMFSLTDKNTSESAKPKSKTSLFSAKKSTSSTSEFQNKHVKPSSSTSLVPKSKLEKKLSITSTREPPAPPVIVEYPDQFPKKVESISSLPKRKSLRKRIKPKQIILSMFQADKNTSQSAKPNSKTKASPPETKQNVVSPPEKKQNVVSPPEKKQNVVKWSKKENDKHAIRKEEHPSTSAKKPALKTTSEHTIKSSGSTRIEESPSGNLKNARTVHYKPEMKNFFKREFAKFKKQLFVQVKEKLPSPLTEQVRAHAFRKGFFKVVARMTEKEKNVHQQLKQLAPLPYPRVHGFTQPVLAKFKCGRLKEKEDEIEKTRKKIKKKAKKKTELEASNSQTVAAKSSETISTSKQTLKTTETKVITKSKTLEKQKKNIKKKTDKDDNEDSDEDDDLDEKDGDVDKQITKTITTITKIKSKTNCPYVIDSPDDKFIKRCCCQFIKALPPTPRETFKKNPGNPHFYPAPGHKRKWTYQLKLRQLQRLEEERQRLCAEQRGLPYNGPPRQYQDFFEDTPVEARCCCDIHKTKKKEELDPNGFECNNGDPHLYPTLAGFKHYFDNREKIKEADRELAALRKKCEETFPEIKTLNDKKTDKSCECRGAIVSGEKSKEEKIKEIVEKMAAICSCLDDCDCKAALQAKEPYINEDEEIEACCCSRKDTGRVNETFDCNAGDPHRIPTVAAFKHIFDFKKKRRARITKRKSIYDEIVQHGTEEEIQEARISLYKQIIEDGTKEEREEARVSLEIEETQIIVEREKKLTKIKKEDSLCNCPEIQEIVVMIEDSDCEDPFYTPYVPGYEVCYEPMTEPEGDYMIPSVPQYQEELEFWENEPFQEMPEVFPEIEQTEPETEPIKLLGATTLHTQTPSGADILTHDPQITTETQTPRTSHTQTENTLETQTPSTPKPSDKAQSSHSVEKIPKTDEQSGKEEQPSPIADDKKRKHKSPLKCVGKNKKISKQDQFMLRSLQPPKCKIKPNCVCFADKKLIIPKQDLPKCTKTSEKSGQIRCECNKISEVRETQTNIPGIPEDLDVKEKTQRKYKCKDKQDNSKYNYVIKSLREPKSYTRPAETKCKRKSSRKSGETHQDDIYYPPPELIEPPHYQPPCQPTNCAYYSPSLPDKEIFNFPPPKFSSIYQEYPQYDISPEKEMLFSVQIEQDSPSCACVPLQLQNLCIQNLTPQPESQTSIHVIFTDEDQNVCTEENGDDESFSSLSSEAISEKKKGKSCLKSCKCKKQEEKVSCRCKEKIPCRC